MPTVLASQSVQKTVADPNAAYESLRGQWDKSRAVCNGEQFVKDYDSSIDVRSSSNLLIPFSPSMTQAQFNFYKAEAELPGITAQFSKMLVGGLLRKQPSLTLPDTVPKEAHDWIMNEFGQDGSTLMSFLDDALWEEMQTSRAWVYVDHPSVDADADLTPEEKDAIRPYPVIWDAEMVINWRVKSQGVGKGILDRVIVHGLTEVYKTDENGEEVFHPEYVKTVWVHELVGGFYQVREFRQEDKSLDETSTNGRQDVKPDGRAVFKLHDTFDNIMAHGERLTCIPAWPLNGSIDPQMPILTAIIDKEIALYNKVSRRNHLLYGAATYTPVVRANMTDDEFDQMVNRGLGSWLKVGVDESIDVLKTPTEALADMDRAIASGIEEMAKLGIRMLSPETEQSGVALQLRNASQTAQLGTLNSKVSSTVQAIITFMLNWRYELDLKASDVQFSLSSDFNPTPLGADWLRLATEWYEKGLIPRTVWLQILKHNDMLTPEYDDKEGQKEITDDQDMLLKSKRGFGDGFASNITAQIQGKDKPTAKAPPTKE